MKHYKERKHYSREDQFRILKEIESGQIDIRSAARKYGISPSGIKYWKIHFGMRPPHGRREKLRFGDKEGIEAQKVRSLEHELERLKIKVGELYIENDFLKKFQEFTEQEKKLNSCVITDQNISQFVKRVR